MEHACEKRRRQARRAKSLKDGASGAVVAIRLRGRNGGILVGLAVAFLADPISAGLHVTAGAIMSRRYRLNVPVRLSAHVPCDE